MRIAIALLRRTLPLLGRLLQYLPKGCNYTVVNPILGVIHQRNLVGVVRRLGEVMLSELILITI